MPLVNISYEEVYNLYMKCIICANDLSGRKKKFCSPRCKNRFFNSGERQAKRGHRRKVLLLNELGFECSVCGYDKNTSALHFHHTVPDNKSFNLDIRRCSGHSIDRLKEEVGKCIILCANCHAELHHPEYDTIKLS